MPRRLLLLLAVIAALALAACGDDDDEDTTTTAETTAETTTAADSGGGETIAITETEFSIDPAEVSAPAGTITFEIANEGGTVHNLEVEGNGVEEVSDTIEPGASGEFTVDLEPGTYELYCAIGDHAEQGMEGELTVE